VFKGTYRYKIDPKGRLPVPPTFRRTLGRQGQSLVLTPLDACLAVYTTAEWERLRRQLEALPAFSKQSLTLTRLLASRAVDATLDVQGRILLPPALRATARLGREAVVVGVLSRFEIWGASTWDAFVSDAEKLLDEVGFPGVWPTSPK
jgi:MraZ protein